MKFLFIVPGAFLPAQSTIGRMANLRHDRELVVQRKMLADNQVEAGARDLATIQTMSSCRLFKSCFEATYGIAQAHSVNDETELRTHPR